MAYSTDSRSPSEIRKELSSRSKLCFVTVGATVSFNSLVQAVISTPFLEALAAEDYTRVRIQYGRTGQAAFDESLERAKVENHGRIPGDLVVEGIDLVMNSDEMDAELMQILGRDGRSEGMLISHAGTGSIMAGMAGGAPLIVVPNTDLADNHQEEIAQAFEELHWVIRGSATHLVPVIKQAEHWRAEMLKPISHQWEHEKKKLNKIKFKKTKLNQPTIQSIMDQEMGYDHKGFDYWEIER